MKKQGFPCRADRRSGALPLQRLCFYARHFHPVGRCLRFVPQCVCLLAFGLCLLASCGKKGEKLTAAGLEEKYGNSVVLVQNQYYFSGAFGALEFWFTGIDSDGDLENLTFDEDEIPTATGYGTGFFVSDDGRVATNCHVVEPSIDESVVRSQFSSLKSVIESALRSRIDELTDQMAQCHNYWLQTPSGSYEEAQFENAFSEAKDERDEAEENLRRIGLISVHDMHITLHRKVGIARNNTFVTDRSDFDECVVVDTDSEHDLAVIQLKSRETPEACAVVEVQKFDEDDERAPYDAEGQYIDVDHLPVGSTLYLLGYNLGPALALTRDGVKAQITQGAISQNTDGMKIMYSIPALHGSSGSPVFDEYGNLVAINFAGLDFSQSFNYGVKVKHLRRLLGDD